MDDTTSDDGLVTVKCAWSRLGSSNALRDAVSDVIYRMHFIAVRGSYIANSILSEVMRNNLTDLPDVISTTFWCQIYKSSGQPTDFNIASCKRRENWDSRVTQTSWRLFGTAEQISMKNLTSFISYLTKDMIANIRTMVTLNFVSQVEKAFLREICLWELSTNTTVSNGTEAEVIRLRCRIANWASRECLEHKFKLLFPPEAPPQLKTTLQGIIDTWNLNHKAVLPCPTPEFAANKCKFSALYRWMLELQLHRSNCLVRATKHYQGNEVEARNIFGDSAKAFRPLPLASRKIKHVVVDKSCLRDLLLTMHNIDENTIPCLRMDVDDQVSLAYLHAKAVKKEKWLQLHPDERDVKKRIRTIRSEESKEKENLKFWHHFPGAAALLQHAGGRKGAKLHPFLRTDGVAVSVSIRKPGSAAHLSGKALLNLKDLDEGNPKPLQPQPLQRIVFIDPGRRDMIFAHIEDYGPPDPLTGNFSVESAFQYKVSTKRMERECHTKRTANVTTSTLKRVYVLPDGQHAESEHVTLLEALENLPGSRAYETWNRYEQAAIPLLDTALHAMQRKAIQKAKFDGYKARDSALDRVCKFLCRGKPIPAPPLQKHALEKRFKPFQKDLPLLVAFGNGRACSTGLGYCPAPQGRLRHRLARLHGAHITIIDEYCTSKKCSTCGCDLQNVHRCRTNGIVRRPRDAKSVIWAVKKCIICRDPLSHLTKAGAERVRKEGPAPKLPAHHWHRDLNAALNMKNIYFSLLHSGERPVALRPRIEECPIKDASNNSIRGTAAKRKPRDDVSSDRPNKRSRDLV